MRPFLMVWNSAQLNVMQAQLTSYLDSHPEIKNYYAPFLGTILLVADHSQTPSKLSWIIHNRFPTLMFSICPVDQWGANGWMPQLFWDLIREPKSSGRWDAGSLAAIAGLLNPDKKK
jgi:hypothetical protein